MKTKFLFTMALMASMMLAGCSKEEENMETNSEQTLTKEQIVGVWRSGDYWVSFAEDGFMCGYLSDKCIVEGNYEVIQDQVNVTSDFFENNITAFKINNIADKLECDVKFSEIEINPIVDTGDFGYIYKESVSLKNIESTMNFTKSEEKPTARENEIVGKRFEYYSVYTLNPDISFGDYTGEINCLSDGYFGSGGSMQRIIMGLMPNGKPDYYLNFHMKGFYVYLAPYVYFIESRDEAYGMSMPSLIVQLYTIQKMEVSFGQSGKILLK